MRASLVPMDTAPDARYLTELERGTRAAILGVILGLVLAVLARRRYPSKKRRTPSPIARPIPTTTSGAWSSAASA